MHIQRVFILGNKGQMAGLIARRAHEAGITVTGMDQPLVHSELSREVPLADMVLLAVPVKALAGALQSLAPLLHTDQILADICSVKVYPVNTMLRGFTGAVVGSHPLFGPAIDQTTQTTGQPHRARVAITPGRDDTALQAVCHFIQQLGFEPFRTTAQEHDKAMAAIQGLNFVTTVSYLATLAHRPELEAFLTPSFDRRLQAAQKMLTQDAALFTNLLDTNPFTQDAVRNFRSMLNIAAGGDLDLLTQRANWWWRQE